MKNEYDVDFENLSGSSNGSLRWISLLVMAMVVFGFFWLMLYAYDNDAKSPQSEMIANISPENESYKVKPDDAGGMTIENKDIEAYQLMRKSPNVANEVEQVERLLPLAERPIVRDIPANEAAILGDATTAKIPQAVASDELLNNDATGVDATGVDATGVDEVINDVLNKQAAQVQAPSAMEQMNNAVAPLIAAPQPQQMAEKEVVKEIAQPIPVPKIITVTPKIATAPKIMPKIVAPKPVVIAPPAAAPVIAKIAPAPTYSPAKPAATTNNAETYIQFAALRTATDAPRVWGELKAKHPELAAYSYYTESVTTATGATLHRLRAKGFADRNQALSICSTLKARGQDCLVSGN